MAACTRVSLQGADSRYDEAVISCEARRGYIAGLRGGGRKRRLGGHAGEQGFQQIGVIFKECKLDGIGRGLLPDDAARLGGVEPTLEDGELKVVARDDAQERDGEAILFAVAVDVAGRRLGAVRQRRRARDDRPE